MEARQSETDQLIHLSRGEVQAFDWFYHRYKQPVYANIFKLVRDHPAAEDILQEVFVKLWEHRQQLQADKSVSGWLFVVSYNAALSFLRQKVKEARVVTVQAELEETAEPERTVDEELVRHQLAKIEEAVDRLPARKQQVFRLLRFEGKSSEDVAELLGISVQSVRDYLKQATRTVRMHVQENPTDEFLLLILFLEFL